MACPDRTMGAHVALIEASRTFEMLVLVQDWTGANGSTGTFPSGLAAGLPRSTVDGASGSVRVVIYFSNKQSMPLVRFSRFLPS